MRISFFSNLPKKKSIFGYFERITFLKFGIGSKGKCVPNLKEIEQCIDYLYQLNEKVLFFLTHFFINDAEIMFPYKNYLIKIQS